ncbi:hypothetical protein B0H14DRAFT_3126848, partial [Mycena olivaceomarginata]
MWFETMRSLPDGKGAWYGRAGRRDASNNRKYNNVGSAMVDADAVAGPMVIRWALKSTRSRGSKVWADQLGHEMRGNVHTHVYLNAEGQIQSEVKGKKRKSRCELRVGLGCVSYTLPTHGATVALSAVVTVEGGAHVVHRRRYFVEEGEGNAGRDDCGVCNREWRSSVAGHCGWWCMSCWGYVRERLSGGERGTARKMVAGRGEETKRRVTQVAGGASWWCVQAEASSCGGIAQKLLMAREKGSDEREVDRVMERRSRGERRRRGRRGRRGTPTSTLCMGSTVRVVYGVGAVTWTSPQSRSTAGGLPSASQQLTRGGAASGAGEGHGSRAARREQRDDGMQASLAQRRMLVVARDVVCEVGGRRGRARSVRRGKGEGIKSAKWRLLIGAQWVRAENGEGQTLEKEGVESGAPVSMVRHGRLTYKIDFLAFKPLDLSPRNHVRVENSHPAS